MNLVTLDNYEKLGLKKETLFKVPYPLMGLSDKAVPVLGMTNLIIILGEDEFRRMLLYPEFAVVDILLSYYFGTPHPKQLRRGD